MKFLIYSNAPNTYTGYGVQTANLATRLRDAGHDVAVAATYGSQGGVQNWHGIRIYPQGYDRVSNDIIDTHADHFFADSPANECWIITLSDVWGIVNPHLSDYNVIAWTPVDHVRIPPDVLGFFNRNPSAIPVAMSQHGHREFAFTQRDVAYIPLSVDTKVYKPTADIDGMTGRQLMDVPEGVFVVGMVGMNKGWAKDRKGFTEAFWGFSQFLKTHPDAVLYCHTEKYGLAEGQNLEDLRRHANIPDRNIAYPNQYAYRMGYSPEMMAAIYTSMDVLLAPSHGEGFCVPLIEAQACGTPVITTAGTSTLELVGPGWLLEGQPEWDAAQSAPYVCSSIPDITAKLHVAHKLASERKDECIRFAAGYDSDKVFKEFWEPFLADLTPTVEVTLREPMPEDAVAVDVLVPVLNRPQNVDPLVESFIDWTDRCEAQLVFLVDPDDTAEFEAVKQAVARDPLHLSWQYATGTFAEKLNQGFEESETPWLLVIGDDVRFHEGWLDAARKLSDRYDVIGTNDTAGKIKNPKVASGAHADHFFVRRAYIEEHGACLDGPGVLAPEAYHHWYTDMEIIALAKARGVFSPCLDSVVEHLHPGYDGDEAARAADPTYMEAAKWAAVDEQTWRARNPLVQMQRVNRRRAA